MEGRPNRRSKADKIRQLCGCTLACIKDCGINCTGQSDSTTKVSIPSVSAFISTYWHPAIISRIRQILTEYFSMSLCT